MPTSISDIHLSSGTVTLSDGSRWQVGPGDLRTIAPWSPGRPAALTDPGLTREILYGDDGSTALVCPADGACARPCYPSRLRGVAS
jgi:hypothetical protein